jgi:hypothetical protein
MHTSLQYVVSLAGGCLGSIVLFMYPVIPAQAGIHRSANLANAVWIPACAGMTGYYMREIHLNHSHAKHVANLCA